MTEFRYLTAAEWGGTWTTSNPPLEKLPDGEAFLHHVGGTAWMGGTVGLGEAKSRAAAIAVFRALNEYAKRPRDPKDGTLPPPGGWGKGYQFLDYDALGWYDRFNDIGWIAEGRGRYRSAATLDRNEEGEAFCMCGNYSLRTPLDAEVELCARGLAYMADQGWTTRTPTIYGHKDNPAHPGATGCPGDYLYPRLPTVRARFAELTAPTEPHPPIPPEDWTMKPLSKRLIDTRLTGQRIAPRASLRVEVGMATQAIVKVAAVRANGAGWLSLDRGVTTVCDWGHESDGDDGVAFVGLDEGFLTITNGPTSCDVIVDLQGAG